MVKTNTSIHNIHSQSINNSSIATRYSNRRPHL